MCLVAAVCDESLLTWSPDRFGLLMHEPHPFPTGSQLARFMGSFVIVAPQGCGPRYGSLHSSLHGALLGGDERGGGGLGRFPPQAGREGRVMFISPKIGLRLLYLINHILP